MNKLTIVRLWSLVTGAMDALTGLWLLIRPQAVLALLRIPPPAAEAWVFLSWIGVFVMGVGLSYGLALGSRERGETVWWFTSIVRLLVAVFLTTKVLAGALPAAWITIAAADAAVAVVQLALIRARWWREVTR